MKYIFFSSDSSILDVIAEPENKLVLQSPLKFVVDVENANLRQGKMSVKLLDEDLRPLFILFPIPKFSPFYEEFKRKVQTFISSGLIDTNHDLNKKHFQYIHDAIDKDVPALVLNMEDLEVGFLVCLVPLTMAAVVFALEYPMPLMKALAISTRDRLTLFFLIRNVAKMRIGQP